MYAPNEQGLVGKFADVVSDLDLLYSGASGYRYFCAVETTGEEIRIQPEYFGEFDGHARIRISATRPDTPSRA